MQKSLNIIFMGTPIFAVKSLELLHKSKHNIIAVITTPDKKSGRGQKVEMSDVKKYAIANNIEVLQPTNLKSEKLYNKLVKYNCDLFVVVAFRMLPEKVWSLPKFGTVNLHASLLPNYRGAAPINWAIINNEKTTGVTTFFIEKEIDTGKIIDKKEIEINNTMNAGKLHDILMEEGSELILKTVNNISVNNIFPLEQDVLDISNIKTAPKIEKETCEIDWNNSVVDIYNKIRGLSPYPGAFSYLQNDVIRLHFKIYEAEIIDDTIVNDKIKILSDAKKTYLHIYCKKGILSIKEIHVQNKKRMDIQSFLRGFDITGYVLC